ncbi:hypothetical protein OS176_00885 [Xanthomonadaceae bacterium XH05]|nr:hypothetical protein [Xanthomonadaceae bacterium XH05]
MPDFLVRDIEPQVADRIKRIARERGWPINDVILRLIKEALGMVQPDMPVPGDIARLAGTFEDEESRALVEAMKALQQLPDDTPY